MHGKVLGNVVHHHKSFVGRDYKAWAQMAPFVIGSYLSHPQKQVLLALSQVYTACIIIQNLFTMYKLFTQFMSMA